LTGGADRRDFSPMAKPPQKPTSKDQREAKLAKALRDNLRRRKGAPVKPAPPKPKDG
jgi:hypothetical protein